MNDWADYMVHCENCGVKYRPPIQAGTPIEVCPGCKRKDNQTKLQTDR